MGMLTSLVGYAIGSEATKYMMKTAASGAKKAVKWLLHSPKRSGYVGASPIAKLMARRTAIKRSGIEAVKRVKIGPDFKNNVRRLIRIRPTGREVSQAKRYGNSMYRKVMSRNRVLQKTVSRGLDRTSKRIFKSSSLRKSFKTTVTHEAQTLPFVYGMFRMEKYQGTIDQDEGFAKWYSTSWAPISLGMGVGESALASKAKLGAASFARAGGGRHLYHATAMGMKATAFLSEKTSFIPKIYRSTMSRLSVSKTSASGFAGTLKAIKKMIPEISDNRSDVIRNLGAESMNSLDRNIQKDLVRGHNKLMGRSTMMKTYNKYMALSMRLERGTGRGTSFGSMKLAHKKDVISRHLDGSTANLVDDEAIISRSLYTLGGETIDLGWLHIDNLKDGLANFIRKDAAIAGTKIAKFLDSGRNLLMSRKSKFIEQPRGIAKTPGYLGIKSEQTMTAVRPYEDARQDLFNIGDQDAAELATSAATIFKDMWGLEKKLGTQAMDAARNHHEITITKMVDYLKDSKALRAKFGTDDIALARDQVTSQYYRNFILDAHKGTYRLGQNEKLLYATGKPSILLDMGTGKSQMQSHTRHWTDGTGQLQESSLFTAINAGSRLGLAYTQLNSGSPASSEGFYLPSDSVNLGDIKYTSGLTAPRNLTNKERFTKGPVASFLGKIGDMLEIGRGAEVSIFSKAISPITKWNNPREFSTFAEALKMGRKLPGMGKMSERNIARRLSTDRDIGVAHTIRGNVDAAVTNGVDNILSSVFEAVRVSGNLQHDTFNSYASALKEMGNITAGVKTSLGMTKFNTSKYAIDKNTSTSTAIENLSELLRKTESFPKEVSGIMNTDLITETLHRLTTGEVDNAWSALGPFSKGKFESIYEAYNKTLFDFEIGLAGTGISLSSKTVPIADSSIIKETVGVIQNIRANASVISRRVKKDIITDDALESAIWLKANGKNHLDPRLRKQYNVTGDDISTYMDNLTMFAREYESYNQSSFMRYIKGNTEKKGYTTSAHLDNSYIMIPDSKELSMKPSYTDISITTSNGPLKIKAINQPISKWTLESMAAADTMNSALGFVGLGFDGSKFTGFTDVFKATLMKRVLPFAGVMATSDVLSETTEDVPILGKLPFIGGDSSLLLDAYAGTRVLSQYVSDFAGIPGTDFNITGVAKYMEDLMPGTINSPLSGVIRGIAPIALGLKAGYGTSLGPLKGGLIGGAVGMLLGGGPLGLMETWDISKGRDRVIKELSGEIDVEVRRGRGWELSSQYFLGEKASYYRPHSYAIAKKKYKRGDNYLGSDILTNLTSYIDPSVYARQHYMSRPYLEAGGIGSNIPFIGFMASTVTSKQYHQEWQNVSDFKSTDEDPQYYMYGGELHTNNSSTKPPIYSSTSAEYAMGQTLRGTLDVAGLRGFLFGSFLGSAFGSEAVTSGNQVVANASSMGSMSREYWNAELGGILGMSEGIRRIIPNRDKNNSLYNPIPNTMPLSWLPGTGGFHDFLHGDPYMAIQEGEIRVPGDSYELTHDVFFSYPIESLIMGKGLEEQVAYYSGDTAYMARWRRNWDTVERGRKELVGRLKRHMQVVREETVGYDKESNVSAKVDAIIKDPTTGNEMALVIAPIIQTDNGQGIESGAASSLNAFLIVNNREIHEGLLVGLDKDGNTTKQIITADINKFHKDVQTSLQATMHAKNLSEELQQEGMSINKSPAYSHLNRFKILADVAPYSKEAQFEMKIVREQVDSGMLKGRALDMYFATMKQYGKKMQSFDTSEYRFIPYLMGKTPIGKGSERSLLEASNYGVAEQLAGGAYEYVSHLRNPISNKLLGKRSAYEAYRADVAIGVGFKSWNTPFDSFIAANMSMVAAEQDPIQALISGTTGGAIFGGPVGAALMGGASFFAAATGLTSNTRARRWKEVDDISVQADAIKYQQYMQIYNETGDESALRKANYTATGSYAKGEVGSYMKIASPMNPNERKYIKKAMNYMYKEDIQKVTGLLPKHIQPLMESRFGNFNNYDTTRDNISDYRTASAGVSLEFTSDDMAYVAMDNQGLNAHDIGGGWFEQSNRIRYLQNSGMDIPSVTGHALPRNPVSSMMTIPIFSNMDGSW